MFLISNYSKKRKYYYIVVVLKLDCFKISSVNYLHKDMFFTTDKKESNLMFFNSIKESKQYIKSNIKEITTGHIGWSFVSYLEDDTDDILYGQCSDGSTLDCFLAASEF